MAITGDEEIKQLEAQADTLQRRLRILDEQIAGYGALAVPPHKVLEQEEAQRALDAIHNQLKQLREAPIASAAPYLGLLTFQEADADHFFGREALIGDLVDKARATAFLAVLGPSGSGKSSVVRAGLIPALKRGKVPGSEKWIYCPPLKPGARPLNSLAAALTSMPGGAALGNVFDLQDRLVAREDALLLSADTLLTGQDGARLVLLVDQVEELWTLAPTEPEARTSFVAQQQRPFIQQLLSELTVPNSPLLILFTMRADFLHRAAEHPALANAIGEHDVIVSPMTAQELRMAIERPAEAAGAGFEHGLVDELIKQTVDRPGALPLLEYALLELWKTKRADGLLTWAAFHELGGVEGALAARADTVLAQRYPGAKQREQLRKALLRLIQPGEGAVDTRRRVRLDDLSPVDGNIADVHALLAPLTDERLLTSGYDLASGTETIEIAHEALIRAWPTFNAWIGAARDDLRFQLQLGDAAQEWGQSNESPDFLWSGLRLANAAAWVERVRPGLNTRDQRFLEACRSAEEQRQAAEQAARQRELSQERAFGQRLRRRAIYLAVAFFVALITAGYAFIQRNDAQNQRNLAQTAQAQTQLQLDVSESRRLADLSRDQLGSASDTALLLAYEAAARNDNAQSQLALRNTLLDHARFVTMYSHHTGAVTSAVFSPDGQHILTVSTDKTARLWDARGNLVKRLSGHTGAVTSAVFSPDGRRILTASADETARLWDARGNPVTTLSGHTGAVNSAMFSSDGQRILTASADETARLWDASGTPLATLSGHTGAVNSAVFSPDGQHILTASADNTARLWDASGNPGPTLSGHTGAVTSAVFSPDGRRILTASFDKTARLWDARGNPGPTLNGHSDAVTSAVFSPDGRRILTISADTTARLWDARGKELATLSGHTGAVTSAVFSPDGQRILTASADETARLWDARGKELVTLSGHTGAVISAVFSPDGQRILTASADKTARLWDARGEPLATLSGHTGAVNSAVFSPDGQRILTASADTTARLWDARGNPGPTLSGHTGAVNSAVFSPDGQRILTASADETARLWDARGKELVTLSGHTGWVTSAVFSPDGQRILTASFDKTARLWDARGNPGPTLSGHTGAVTSAMFSPDGQRILTVSADETARLWDARGNLVTTLSGHTGAVTSAVFSPDGQRILTASADKTARLWDARGNLVTTLSGHTGAVTSAVFSPDGQRILTASADKTARLWDARGEPLATLSGHTGAVNSAVFSPDGQRILTASADTTARLWDASGNPGPTLSGHTGAVNSAVFSPDGRRILTASSDQIARQYIVNVADLLAAAACRVDAGLTASDIARFRVLTPLKFDFAQRPCPPAIGR